MYMNMRNAGNPYLSKGELLEGKIQNTAGNTKIEMDICDIGDGRINNSIPDQI